MKNKSIGHYREIIERAGMSKDSDARAVAEWLETREARFARAILHIETITNKLKTSDDDFEIQALCDWIRGGDGYGGKNEFAPEIAITAFGLGAELMKRAKNDRTASKMFSDFLSDNRRTGANTTREKAKVRKSLLRGRFVVERKEFPDTERPNIIRRIRTHFSDKQKPDHKIFWVKGRSYGLSDSTIEKACAGLK